MPSETTNQAPEPPDHLHVEAIKYAGLSELEHAEDEAERIEIVARLILDVFQDYYVRSRSIPLLAKTAFEQREWQTSLELSQERLSIYSTSVTKLAPLLKFFCPEVQGKDAFWKEVERHYLSLIDGWYQADLAFAFVHSTRRMIYQDQWRPVAYSSDEAMEKTTRPSSRVYREFPCSHEISPALVERILGLPAFTESYQDLRGDS
ncbi:MAG: isocitrate dehydrogenase kinase/phosphatase AceK regulatory subunit, partial [Methyloligellaceae bacterium]